MCEVGVCGNCICEWDLFQVAASPKYIKGGKGSSRQCRHMVKQTQLSALAAKCSRLNFHPQHCRLAFIIIFISLLWGVVTGAS